MTTSLSAGPLTGMLTASGSSPVFSIAAAKPYAARVRVLASPTAFQNSTVSLLMSADGGATWSPRPARSPAVGLPIIPGFPSLARSGGYGEYMIDLPNDETGNQYQITATMNGGSLIWVACQYDSHFGLLFGSFGIDNPVVEPGTPHSPSQAIITIAKLKQYLDLQMTPLTVADITAPFTAYMILQPGLYATLSVPAGATTSFDNTIGNLHGLNRQVILSKATVSSIVDKNNNPVISGTSWDTGQVFTTGATVSGSIAAYTTMFDAVMVSAAWPYPASFFDYGL